MAKDKETVETVSVMLPPSQIKYLQQEMAAQDLTRSQLIRKMIREYQMVHQKSKK